MRVLMLGWEFPPFIAGGLGTACYGLTKAFDRLGHTVVFVLPRPVDSSHASHVRLLSPVAPAVSMPRGPVPNGAGPTSGGDAGGTGGTDWNAPYRVAGFEHTVFRAVPATFSSPYPDFSQQRRPAGSGPWAGVEWPPHAGPAPWEEVPGEPRPGGHGPAASADGGVWVGSGGGYVGDVIGDSERYARLVVALCRRETFDIIHAHDWMTFPAGMALAYISGKPLVVHVHSTEFDRSGEHVNQRIYDIERRGMHAATRVIAVSMLTKSVCVRRYGVSPDKIDVVYNGIDSETAQPPEGARVSSRDKIVLFLGRITMQKGPEYFIAAARRVLEKVPEAKFVVAGAGDMAVRMIELAAQYGIGHRVLFTGFLRGPQVDRIFRMADCYVMPSVSEPFGIAPLEAMRNDVPVIISKQSGVSEVLQHVLKVDFWDVDEMANKIVAVLRHPPLGQTLREHGSFELRKLTWEGAAERCLQTYHAAVEAQRAVARV